MTEAAVLPGAEPFSAAGSAGQTGGVLVLHGFTGSPHSMRGLAQAFAAAGNAVELPRLPGHGTSVDDMADTRWSDWSATAEECLEGLQARCSKVVVAGLSMGGTLAVWLAARHPELAGIVVVNPAVDPLVGIREVIEQTLAEGVDRWPSIGGDIADPDATELSYDAVPVRCMLSLAEAVEDLGPKLSSITCPVLAFWSPQDHVVTNASSQTLVDTVSGPVELVVLERSFHVATLDFDRALIDRRAVEFVAAMTA